jgi:broad specificity phosphatase PhoE
MRRLLYFITHPNVVIDKDVPVPRWPLSAIGRERMVAGLRQPWIRDVSAVYCSTEQKAIDGASVIAQHLDLPFHEIEDLGENDRSATGFLHPSEFERVADEFFACPTESVRGWERAADAQHRIVSAVTAIAARDTTSGSIAIVSHGAVGTLLYCWLSQQPISRRWDQPRNGGGNFYAFALQPPAAHSHWRVFDLSTSSKDFPSAGVC